MTGQPASDKLTQRQREVLDLVARGLTNAQIAERLGISLDGAKWHVSEVIRRMDVRTREEAAELWRKEQRPWRRMRGAIAGLALGRAALAAIGGTVGAVVGGIVLTVVIASDGLGGEAPHHEATPVDRVVPIPRAIADAKGPVVLYADHTDRGLGVGFDLRAVDTATGEELVNTRLPGAESALLAGDTIVAPRRGTELVQYDLAGNELRTLHRTAAHAVSLSPDGTMVAFVDGALRVLDLATGDVLATLEHADVPAIFEDARMARTRWTGPESVAVELEQRSTPETMGRPPSIGFATLSLSGAAHYVPVEGQFLWSPDGSRILVWEWQAGFCIEQLRALDTRTGREVLSWNSRGETVIPLAWAADGSKVALAATGGTSEDCILRLEDTEWRVLDIPAGTVEPLAGPEQLAGWSRHPQLTVDCGDGATEVLPELVPLSCWNRTTADLRFDGTWIASVAPQAFVLLGVYEP